MPQECIFLIEHKKYLAKVAGEWSESNDVLDN